MVAFFDAMAVSAHRIHLNAGTGRTEGRFRFAHAVQHIAGNNVRLCLNFIFPQFNQDIRTGIEHLGHDLLTQVCTQLPDLSAEVVIRLNYQPCQNTRPC